MKIFLVSNGIWEYDGRLRELLSVANTLGDSTSVTRAEKLNSSEKHITVKKKSYIYFILFSIVKAVKTEKIDVLFIDNRKAIVPGIFIKLMKNPKVVILDVRELYFKKEVNHFIGKIGCMLEGFFIKRAGVIICANKQRSIIMQEYYKLKEPPLVYENIRQLYFSKTYNEELFNMKYDGLFKKNTFRIISTSGCSVSRTNDKLVESMAKLGNEYELFLVGGGTSKDKEKIETIINKYNLKNVVLIDMLDMDELKFLIKNCNVGVVNYHQNDLNNKYCASGKIYEFLFEGIPIITTENEPLKEICKDYRIGVSNNDYYSSIIEVNRNYDYYKNNTIKLIENLDAEQNNQELTSSILGRIKGQMYGG